MGSDYGYGKLFIKGTPKKEARRLVLQAMDKIILEKNMQMTTGEDVAHFSAFLIEDGEDWLHASGTGWIDYGFGERNLMMELSKVFPMVYIFVDDEASVSLYLYEKGIIIDQYTNSKSSFSVFKDVTEANPWVGDTAKWTYLLKSEVLEPQLRDLWQFPATVGIERKYPKLWFTELFDRTYDLFGWNKKLLNVAYSFDVEGTPMPGISNLYYEEDEILHLEIDYKHFKSLKFPEQLTVKAIFDEAVI